MLAILFAALLNSCDSKLAAKLDDENADGHDGAAVKRICEMLRPGGSVELISEPSQTY